MIPELRTFLAVTRLNTFTAAGDSIGLTQTAVSGHIRRLEQHFGVTLFDRSRRSAVLNEEGRRFMHRAKSLVAMFDALAEPDQENDAPTLHIGAISSAQSRLLVPALQAFRESFPASQIKVRPGQSLHLFDAIDAGHLDLAIVIRPMVSLPETFVWTELLREPYVLAVPPGTPDMPWQDILRDMPFLRYDRSSYGGRAVAHFLERENIAPNEIAELDDLPALWAMVENGLGAAILPIETGAGAEKINVPTFEIGPDAPFRSIGMLHSKDVSSAVTQFASCLLSAAR